MDDRFDPDALRRFATAVLCQAGLPTEPAEVVAEGLVAADLYGHTTHGLALLPGYVEEIASGAMATEGRPEVVADHGAAVTWDARRLPGVWTTALAVEEAERRAASLGVGAVAIRRSHHIACLAAFLEAPARRGTLVLVYSSDPSDAFVAPYGGTTPVMTPNPMAVGIPGTPDPVLIDISASITTAGLCGRAKREGRRLPGQWLLAPDGTATDDPTVFGNGGTILPTGGLDHGHKGYALGLMIEALTQGLPGYGRADAPTGWGAGVLVLAFAPALFAGLEPFLRQTDWLAAACRASPQIPGGPPVRLPGQAALERRREAERSGVVLHPGIAEALTDLGLRHGVAVPPPLP